MPPKIKGTKAPLTPPEIAPPAIYDASLVELLKMACEQQSWPLVQAAYKILTSGKGASAAPETQSSSAAAGNRKLLSKITSNKFVIKGKINNKNKQSGPVQGGKMAEVTDATTDSDLAEYYGSIEQTKDYRPKAKSIWKVCACGKKFDVNVAYPVGTLDPEAKIFKCQKCQSRRA